MVDTATPTTIPTTAHAPATPTRRLRIALAHDWLCGLRGGEHVLERLAELVTREHEPAGLYVMFDDGLPLTATVDAMPHTVSRVGRWPGATRLRRWLLPMYPRAVAELSDMLEREHRRRAIDLVISTSSAAVKGLRPPRGVPHLCYCHSPARYVWSRSDEYAGGLRGLGLLVWGERFRRWDARSAANVTRFVANSEYTARLISQSYRRGATVVYPPLRDEFLASPVEQGVGDERPWLVVSALEPYKRVDLAILAANQANRPLVIVGHGSQREALEKLAGPTVRFVGRASEDELMAWYRRARLVLFPQVEDFGLVAVEAQACGVPVVARRDGGALETVVEGKTGAFFGEPSPQALLRAAEACPDACAEACRANAERFSGAAFDAAMRREIAETMSAGAA